MTAASGAVLIGVGNQYRQDDGIGPALATIIGELDLPGVTVIISDGEPSRLLDAWSGARLAVVVDAARNSGDVAGQIHRRCLTGDLTGDLTCDEERAGWACLGSASTHGLGIGEAIHLAQVMDRMPERLIVFTVEAADIGYGLDLSKPVADSLPWLTQEVLAELSPSIHHQ